MRALRLLVPLTALSAILLAASSAAAICASSPFVGFETQSDPPECMTLSYDKGDTVLLYLRNDCSAQASVERVDCTDCEAEAISVASSQRGELEVPMAEETGVRVESRYRWTLENQSGVVDIATERLEPGSCNDTVKIQDGGCSTTGDAPPASWWGLLLVGSLLYWRRQR